MMKIIWTIILAVIFVSCGQSENSQSSTSPVKNEAQEQSYTTNEVILTAQPDTLELSSLPDTLNIVMTNYTTDTVTTGLHYCLEFYEKDLWMEVSPKEMVFNDIGFRLVPGGSQVFVIGLYKDSIPYQEGRYRVIKYYLASDYSKTKESHDVYAEFTILSEPTAFHR